MNDTNINLSHVKWGLLALLLALGIGGGAAVLSQNYLDHARQAHQHAEHQLTYARHRLITASDDQRNMAAYALEYSMLLQRDAIGNEQRLDWIDGLERLRQRDLVLGFTYTIDPQQPYKPPIPLDEGNYELNRSDMTIDFKLLHEGQLVNFFNALRTNVKGWYMLDGCIIERIPHNQAVDDEPGLTPQLKAECKGGWLTLKLRSKQ